MDSRTGKLINTAMSDLNVDATEEIRRRIFNTNQRAVGDIRKVSANTVAASNKMVNDKNKLWEAARLGNLEEFNRLFNSGIIKDVNEYNESEGITLLHAVVSGDVYYSEGQFAEIAMILLQSGAKLELPAVLTQEGKKPNAISVGESSFEAARRYSYASKGHSYIFDGFRVLPVFQKHLDIIPPKKNICDNLFYAAAYTRALFWEAYGNKQKSEAATDELRAPSYKF